MTGPANMEEKNEKIDLYNFVTGEHSITSLTDKHYSLDSDSIKTSITNNSSFQNYPHPNDQIKTDMFLFGVLYKEKYIDYNSK